jgi:hypothetical protein
MRNPIMRTTERNTKVKRTLIGVAAMVIAPALYGATAVVASGPAQATCTPDQTIAIAQGTCGGPGPAMPQTPIGQPYVPVAQAPLPQQQLPVAAPPPARSASTPGGQLAPAPAPGQGSGGGGDCNVVSPGNNTDGVNAFCGAIRGLTGN